MIICSKDFDLGRDRTRISDPKDAARQQCTVDALLDRFFNPRSTQRFEIQILADEVGMGKTFVALGLAYSILAHLKQGRIEADLEGCYQRVLVLTPNNHALYRKWVREVDEFKRRCVLPESQSNNLSFAPLEVDRLDDLAVALRKPGRQPQIVVARMGLFGGGKLLNYKLKRRLLLGVLFRFWGVRFNYECRHRLLKGAPPDWPNNHEGLTVLTEQEDQILPFTEDQLLSILNSLRAADSETLDSLLAVCHKIAEPFYRDRAGAFAIIERKLIDIYRLAVHRSIQRDFPLLIVDEAHNWKNGPLAGTNGFENFSKHIAPHVRRALLLTATPFQLRPEEMIEILKVADFIEPCPTQVESSIRRERLTTFREETLRPALHNSEIQSGTFSRAWVRIPHGVTAEALVDAWNSPDLAAARKKVRAQVNAEGDTTSLTAEMTRLISGAIAGADPDIRQFLKEALYLDAYNAGLSRELGKLVVRHRRQTEHRFFRVGLEYGQTPQSFLSRPDGHILHAAPGLDIRGEAELPQFLLMRCVSEMKQGKGRSSLGSDLTGCYSTLHESAEGRRVKQSLKESPTGRLYLDLLFGMVNKRHDPKHPKLSCVVSEVLQHWNAGEKVLIFCFRINTAERLRDIISNKIRRELEARKRKCLGGEGQIKTLRARLTGRDRDLIVLGLDRILWSFVWARRGQLPLDPRQFILEDNELSELAYLSIVFGVDVTGERVDRVFLNRVTEHLLATRLLKLDTHDPDLCRLLKRMSQREWIADPYGLQYRGEQDDQSEETSSFDERGCHTKYIASENEPDAAEVSGRADALRSTRQRARTQKQIPLLDSYALSPSLWLGADPQGLWQEPASTRSTATLRMLHTYLWQLTDPGELDERSNDSEQGGLDCRTRALVFQALRRALLRESVLLRLLPQRSDLDETGWGELLARSFLADLPNQHESMAHRVAIFLEDVKACSGNIAVPSSARGALYEATRLRDQQFVALVKGGGGNMLATRDRIFNGFNTPLLPEILICTQVGQEGIDLHRHCRHVVHYDLAWNPAVLEQRTGRADRIGSKTFRERDAAADPSTVVLEIGVPFVAGTYDERMYEELRLRAQTFEVLTGGDFAADHADGQDDTMGTQGKELGLSVLPLPPKMISDLRVKLHVWAPPESPEPRPDLAVPALISAATD
ncbi:hypothetical protein SBA4_3460015 [Candidatus Sulfopaludibacter sp. SbA4]|nr:hypothetical protein SBA4_3460015 [Candidatus Sulfopaludibacter sp. SbA4]